MKIRTRKKNYLKNGRTNTMGIEIAQNKKLIKLGWPDNNQRMLF
jgi:hypothetical protein